MKDIESNPTFDDDDFAVLIGNREWMMQNTIPLPKQVDQLMTIQEEQGQTAVLVAIDGILLFFCLEKSIFDFTLSYLLLT